MLWFCFLEGSPALGIWLHQYLFCSEDLPLLVYIVFTKLLPGLYLLGALPASHSRLTGIFSGCKCEYRYLMSTCVALYWYPQRRKIDHVWVCTGLVWPWVSGMRMLWGCSSQKQIPNVHSIYFNIFLIFCVWFYKGALFSDMLAPSFRGQQQFLSLWVSIPLFFSCGNYFYNTISAQKAELIC